MEQKGRLIKKNKTDTTQPGKTNARALSDAELQELKEAAEDSNYFFTQEDRLEYPNAGHIPGSFFAKDGKVVTNPGLRHTGYRPEE